MAIDVIHHRPQPVLPQAPALDDLELQFDGLQGVRDELADLLTDPFFEPLRVGIDAQLARLYRAIQAHHPWPRDPLAWTWCPPIDGGRLISWPAAIADLAGGHGEFDGGADAPLGAGDDVEAYRG